MIHLVTKSSICQLDQQLTMICQVIRTWSLLEDPMNNLPHEVDIIISPQLND